jgi:hypothetical protein
MDVDVYTRTDLDQILSEQKLQMSGLIDESTLVQMGKIVGLTHIVTGNIDNINIQYKDVSNWLKFVKTQTPKSNWDQKKYNDGLKLLKSLSGITADVELSIKMLDVETGKVLFAKTYTAHARNNGDSGNVDEHHKLAAVKKALKFAMNQSNNDLLKVIPFIAKIIKTKGARAIALVDKGMNYKLRMGDKFDIIKLTQTFNGKVVKEVVGEMVVSDQIYDDQTWCLVSPGSRENFKAGYLAILKSKVKTLKEVSEEFHSF